MKNRLLSILLVMYMILALLPAEMLAVEADLDNVATLPSLGNGAETEDGLAAEEEVPGESEIPEEFQPVEELPNSGETEDVFAETDPVEPEKPEMADTPDVREENAEEDGSEVQLYSGNVEWTVTDGILYFNEGTGIVVDCDASVTYAEIPAQISGVKVTGIGANAFKDCASLTGVVIPDSVTSIGNYAFGNCTSLTGVVIPDSVTSMGSNVFYSCGNLENVTFSNGMKSIPQSAFYRCLKLTDFAIPSGVTSIEPNAFYHCKALEEIVIPEGVTKIGMSAFLGCDELRTINIPAGVTSIGEKAFSACPKLEGNITIPNAITAIGTNLFYGCSKLSGITLHNGITHIGDEAFRGCSGLTSFVIPDSVTSIGKGAFSYCRGLTSIVIPGSINSIGISLFSNCSGLTSVMIPSNITSIGDYMFSGCSSLTEVTIQNGVTNIGTSAFSECKSLQRIDIPESVTAIGVRAFAECDSLTDISISEGVLSIEDAAFTKCTALESIFIPGSVSAIKSYAFSGCKNLVDVALANGIVSIGESAFYECGKLAEIRIPGSVAVIGDYAFSGCGGPFYVDSANPYYKDIDGVLFNKSGSCLMYFPSAQNGTYDIPRGVTRIGGGAFWSSKLSDVAIPAGVTRIESAAFGDCGSLIEIAIPDGVTYIGSRAFAYCNHLKTASIPASATIIDQEAFLFCDCLADIFYGGTEAQWTQIQIGSGNSCLDNAAKHFSGGSITANGTCGQGLAWSLADGILTISGDGAMDDYNAAPNMPWRDVKDDVTAVRFMGRITHIGACAFYNCGNLLSAIIPDSVTSIGGGAFHGCGKLLTIHIPSGIAEIGWSMFADCTQLTSVNIPDGVTSIGAGAFSGCGELTRIDIPPSVTEIGESAFYACGKLRSIVIPSGVSQIGWGTFRGCAGLKTVTIPYSVDTIMDDAFNGCGLRTHYDGAVYYESTEKDWKKINIGENNDPLIYAKICYAEDGVSHTVTFRPNGGVVNSVSKQVTNGQPYGDLPVPQRDGFRFTGWFTASAGGALITAETGVHLSADQTLYARWEAYGQTAGWQHFGFPDTENAFFRPGETKDYSAGDYFDHFPEVLKKFWGVPEDCLDVLRSKQAGEWRGSCFGFAALEGMVNAGLLPAGAIETGAESLGDISAPKDNVKVRDLLNYYQLTQFIPQMRNKTQIISTSEGQSSLRGVANDVLNGEAIMFCYAYGNRGSVIILKGGSRMADGSYALTGYDSRFHGDTLCDLIQGQWVDTERPLTVSVRVSADFSDCTVSLEGNTHFMREGKLHYLEDGFQETVSAFEPYYSSGFHGFVNADPTGKAANTASVRPFGAENTAKSVLYYEPNGQTAPIVIKDKTNQVLLDSADLDSASVNWWYTYAGTANTVGVEENGATRLTLEDAPVGMMAELKPATEESGYTISGIEGTVSCVGGGSVLSVSAKSAASATIDLAQNTVALEGNPGDFSITVNTDGTAATVSGKIGTGDGVKVSSMNGSISLEAPAGDYNVIFVDPDNRETSKVVTSSGGGARIEIPVPKEKKPVICEKYAGAYQASMNWNGNTFILTLTNSGSEVTWEGMTAWQAIYDEQGKMISVEKLLSSSVPQNGDISFSGTISPQKDCRLYVFDSTYSPVIEKYYLGLDEKGYASDK